MNRYGRPVLPSTLRRAGRSARHGGWLLLFALPNLAMAGAYTGHSGRAWSSDFGVLSGACDRDRVGRALDDDQGARERNAGKGHGETRHVAIAAGAVIGAVIGPDVGRRMDRTDRSCVGLALELSDAGRSVRWTNPNTRVTYQLTPLPAEAVRDPACRPFRLIAHGDFGLTEGRTLACADLEGVWRPAHDARVSKR